MSEPPKPVRAKSICSLPLSVLPDGTLASVLSYLSAATDILAVNRVCRSWVISGDRVDLWKALGESFEVAMPLSLGRPAGGSRWRGGGKRVLRSAANAKRTFYKSYAADVATHRLKHDGALSEAYTLFRMADSVRKVKSLLKRRWGSMINTLDPGKMERTYSVPAIGKKKSAESGFSDGGSGSRRRRRKLGDATLWVAGSGRWKFDVDHRHGIYEGNTLLNFAVRCGRRKTVEFIIRQMGADVEAADDGGFTPLLNAAWRGDAGLVQQLYEAGASLDVEGVSRGEGPYGPLEWAERKDRPKTAALIRKYLNRAEDAYGITDGKAANKIHDEAGSDVL